jgi:predicted DsbA family dithiol-disulfide isomerase
VADVPAVSVSVLTDPYCPWSWAAEPQLRRLQFEFGAALRFTFVIAGLKRDPAALAYDLVEAAAASGMPADARVFLRDPPASTQPAGLAITAVAEQGDPGPYIRRLREAILLERRRMDTAPALLDAAREVGELDLERLRIDFGSNAIVERFGADIERGRGVKTPAIVFGSGEPVPPGPSRPATATPASRTRCGGSARWRRRRSPRCVTCRGRARRPSCGGSRWSGACDRAGCPAASSGSSRSFRRRYPNVTG